MNLTAYSMPFAAADCQPAVDIEGEAEQHWELVVIGIIPKPLLVDCQVKRLSLQLLAIFKGC